MSKIKYFILQHVFPGFYATHANKIVSKNYEKQQNFDVDLTGILGNEKDYISQVNTDLEEQHDRKKIIEDKAKSLLFIIAVSITAITFTLNYLNNLIFNLFQIMALIILGLSILYFVFGVIRALQTLNIRRFHVIQAEIEITDKDFKLREKKKDDDYLKDLIKSKQLNDLINIQLSNYTYASFNLIRNGIILFVIFFGVTICGNYFSKKEKTNDIYSVRKEIKMTINDTTSLKIPYTFEVKYDLSNLEIDKKQSK